MRLKSFLFMLLLLTAIPLQAKDIRKVKSIDQAIKIDTPVFLITHKKPFYGLAFIYNKVQPIYLINNEVVFIDPEGNQEIPNEVSHFGWKSRYQLALIENKASIQANFENNSINIQSNQQERIVTTIGYTDEFAEFSEVKYAHLWNWLRQISLGIEWLLSTINLMVGHWGWSIVVLSVVMKLLLMPLSLLTLKYQKMVSKNQTLLAPKLAEIKQKYKGEKAHNEMMAAHKALGITPFYTLKPMLTIFIQIPVLTAIFNVLGEMSSLKGHSFLWVNDLSLPDTLFDLGFAIPLLGTGFNLLPILMASISLLSTVYYKNDLAPENETKKQKINLYLMALVFFVLFYPFPASMVLYWALANFLQFIQQKTLGN